MICDVDTEDAASLLWFAYLFTGDEKASENAVLAALDFEMTNPSVATSRLESLTTSVLGEVLTSLQFRLAVSERRTESRISLFNFETLRFPEPAWCETHDLDREILEQAILAIDLFPRCVLLLTFFEKYTVDHVASLLGSTKRLTKAAQALALSELTSAIARCQGWLPDAACDNLEPVSAFAVAV